MTATLRKCLAIEGIQTVSIATGYWDIPALAMLQEQLKSFLEKKGTKLRLLIGKDPYIYTNQLKKPKYKNAAYAQDFIRTDIHQLCVTEEYKGAIRLLLDYLRKTMIRKSRYAFFAKTKTMTPNSCTQSVTSLTVKATALALASWEVRISRKKDCKATPSLTILKPGQRILYRFKM